MLSHFHIRKPLIKSNKKEKKLKNLCHLGLSLEAPYVYIKLNLPLFRSLFRRVIHPSEGWFTNQNCDSPIRRVIHPSFTLITPSLIFEKIFLNSVTKNSKINSRKKWLKPILQSQFFPITLVSVCLTVKLKKKTLLVNCLKKHFRCI